MMNVCLCTCFLSRHTRRLSLAKYKKEVILFLHLPSCFSHSSSSSSSTIRFICITIWRPKCKYRVFPSLLLLLFPLYHLITSHILSPINHPTTTTTSSCASGWAIIGFCPEPKTGKWISSGSLSSSSSASSTEFDIVLWRTVKFTLNIASATPPGDDTTNENVRCTLSCIRT